MATLKETQHALHDFLQGKSSAITDFVVGKNPAEIKRRLKVYQEAYQLRLQDNLRKQYPILAKKLDKDFEALAHAYEENFPPKEVLIRRYGCHVPAFLKSRGEDFYAELAVFEWAMNVALDDSAESNVLTMADLQQLGEEGLMQKVFAFHPSFQSFVFYFDVPSFWMAAQKKLPATTPQKLSAPLYVSVWRKDLVSYHATRTLQEHQLLQAAQQGASFADLCELADANTVAQAVFRWVNEGLLVKD